MLNALKTNNYITTYNFKKANASFGAAKLSDTETAALTAYKGVSADVNSFLRNVKNEYMYYSHEKCLEIIKYMNLIMQKASLNEDMVLYRICKDPAIKAGMREYTDKGFMNTCKRYDKAKDMVKRWGVPNHGHHILKIHAPKGTRGIDVEKILNRRDEEAEVILPSGSKFTNIKFHTLYDIFPRTDIEQWEKDLYPDIVAEMTLRKA